MTNKFSSTDFFNLYLQLPTDELVWELDESERFAAEELDFLINPRRLRGSDFLMRWSQGEWSEERLIQAVIETKDYLDTLRTKRNGTGR